MERFFTVDEANALLLELQPLVGEILAIRQEVLERKPYLWPVIQRAIGNGGSHTASQVALDFKRLEALVRKVQTSGAHLKDINTGLLDFLSWREGRKVYLCWRYGEAEIQYWHEIEGGFRGRQPL